MARMSAAEKAAIEQHKLEKKLAVAKTEAKWYETAAALKDYTKTANSQFAKGPGSGPIDTKELLDNIGKLCGVLNDIWKEYSTGPEAASQSSSAADGGPENE